MIDMPHQIISKTIVTKIFVVVIRDPADGSSRHAVAYEAGITRWVSRHRFPDVERAESAAVVLADWLGAEYRG